MCVMNIDNAWCHRALSDLLFFSLSPHPNVTKTGPQIQGGPTESNRHFSYIDFTDIHAVDQQPESVDATIRGSFTQPDQRLLTENSISKEDIDNIVFQGT